MKSHRQLFELYLKGILPDEKITELNELLIQSYFHSSGELNQDELFYTEEYLMESYCGEKLEEPYHQMFREKIFADKALDKKYLLFLNLNVSKQAKIAGNSLEYTDKTEDEDIEEEQLKSVLKEVFEKAHSEKETTGQLTQINRIIQLVKDFFEELISSFQLNQPQFRLVVAIASVTILIGLGWVIFRPAEKKFIAENAVKPSPSPNDPLINLPNPTEKEAQMIRENAEEKIKDLIASFFEHAAGFEYSVNRGETTSATDTFILAAELYNEKRYDSCMILLNELLSRNELKDPDTLNEINFFLGNCHLILGRKQNSKKQMRLAIHSFEKIDSQSQYFLSSKWYSVFAYATLGNIAESSRILDSLAHVHYTRHGKVIALRDSISIQNTRNEKVLK
jgi:hypothetical protein